jgi:hypothetical protein
MIDSSAAPQALRYRLLRRLGIAALTIDRELGME